MSMDVGPIITRLSTVSELQQVVAAESGGSQALVDTTTELVSLFGATFGERVYPLMIPETDPAMPNMVYQRVTSAPGLVDGRHILQQDSFVLTVRDSSYDNLVATENALIALMSGSTYALEVTDLIEEYDATRNAYVANMEVLFTYIRSTSQTLPAAFVFPLQRQANDTEHDGYVQQLTRNEYGICVITSGGDVPALLTAIEENLIGWSQSSVFQEIRYLRGNSLEGVSSLEVWREVYFDANHLRQI